MAKAIKICTVDPVARSIEVEFVCETVEAMLALKRSVEQIGYTPRKSSEPYGVRLVIDGLQPFMLQKGKRSFWFLRQYLRDVRAGFDETHLGPKRELDFTFDVESHDPQPESD